jgi:hypothetical protein
VSKATWLVSVYFLLRSWIVCSTVWITSVGYTVFKASLLTTGAENETTHVTVAA